MHGGILTTAASRRLPGAESTSGFRLVNVRLVESGDSVDPGPAAIYLAER